MYLKPSGSKRAALMLALRILTGKIMSHMIRVSKVMTKIAVKKVT